MIGELERVPQQILTNWLHGHALDEYAIGYDSITVLLPKTRSLLFLKTMSFQDRLGTRVRNTHRKRTELCVCSQIVRLIAVLEMIDTTDDLHSDAWKQFVLRFADSITPAGRLLLLRKRFLGVLYSSRDIYQDRLGTNISGKLKKTTVCSRLCRLLLESRRWPAE